MFWCFSPSLFVISPALAVDTESPKVSAESLTALHDCMLSSAVNIQSGNQRIAEPDTSCYAGAVGCGQTVTGRVSIDSCEASGLYGVGYAFNGTAGQSVTISAVSYDFAMTVVLGDGRTGNNTIYAQKDVYVTGQTATIAGFTLPYTGQYLILVTPGTDYTFGNYSLTVTCASTPPAGGSCTPDTYTACMLGNRFKVNVRYRGQFDNSSVDTNARVKPVTGFANAAYETAFFYFNDSNNIEMMVKLLDQGNKNSAGKPTIAVLFGSATPLRTEVTITDTASFSGAWKAYTSNFNTQAGTTDFTAFVK